MRSPSTLVSGFSDAD
jgi:hypothetical protein